MTTRSLRLAAAGLAAALWSSSTPARAQNVKVKLATLVPEGSSWHTILMECAERWKQISGGRVTVVIYPSGTQGDDPDVVRKMQFGSLNAAVLTAVGVAEVDRSVFALGVPLMYESYDEVYHVLEKMRPRLEANLEARGFVVLNWADGGWVHFFTTRRVATPDDLKQLRLFAWGGDHDAVEIQKEMGFQPVPLPATEIPTALKTGLVTALGAPPQVAVISGYYTDLQNMTDLKWQLLLGATVIRKETWEKIPADLRPALLEAARDAGRKLREAVRQSGQRDLEAMKKRGLKVVPVDDKARRQWQQVVEGVYPRIKGGIVPADAFDEALRHRDEYRKRAAAGLR